jgi:hypothetical protein
MIFRQERSDLLVRAGENIVIDTGQFGTIRIMEGGNLELGEDVEFDRVILNSDTERDICVTDYGNGGIEMNGNVETGSDEFDEFSDPLVIGEQLVDGWYSDEFFEELERADVAFDKGWCLQKGKDQSGEEWFRFFGDATDRPRITYDAKTMYAAVHGAVGEADRRES